MCKADLQADTGVVKQEKDKKTRSRLLRDRL